VTGEGAAVEDLGSKNGTWVGQVPVSGVVAVRDGDELRLGSILLVVRFDVRASFTATIERPRL